jgi:hypothetical protein
VLGEHQIVAVARIREALDAFGGVILADEPGLGKSFVAAAVAATEKIVDVVVPASLLPQWRTTLRDFDVDARLLTHDGMVTDPFVPEGRRRLVIVDEAHAFRNPQTQRYAALARRTAGARVLLVTATPICNSITDLKALIDVIAADDALRQRGVPSIDVAFDKRDGDLLAAVVSALVIRRGREDLPAWLHFGSLRRRVERHAVGTVGIKAAIDALQFPLVGADAILRHFLWRRLESSQAALIESLRRQLRFYERALECFASGRALPKREYRRVFAHEEDADAFQQVLFWEVFVHEKSEITPSEVEEEMRRIDALIELVTALAHSKRDKLLELVGGTEEPALIFSGWTATATDLFQALRSHRRTVLVTGRERTRAADAIEAFRSGRADVLVSTDLGAEGLNLQRAAVVIHYDIPWNPVKLEQRDGRAHRIGQRRDVVNAVYFLPEERESGIIAVVAAKNRVRRRALSGGQAILPVLVDPSLRPHLTASAAVIRFARALELKGWSVPEPFLRRHRAGFEQLLDAMSREYLDEARLNDLAVIALQEPWGASRAIGFGPL